jgi:DNA polymerase III epsilon subunit-like protein
MKYVSLDLETSGLDPEKNQILEFGAILEDTENQLNFEEIPKFSCIIEQKEICGQPIALDMNERIIKILSMYWREKDVVEKAAIKKRFNIIEQRELTHNFLDWLAPYFATEENSNKELEIYSYDFSINVAGKNYASFDGKFLEKISGWKELVKIERRIIDPSVLYMDWTKDLHLPSLDECLKRAGIEKTVTHTAVEDAWDVIQVLRKKY